jgi:hypothetical protein
MATRQVNWSSSLLLSKATWKTAEERELQPHFKRSPFGRCQPTRLLCKTSLWAKEMSGCLPGWVNMSVSRVTVSLEPPWSPGSPQLQSWG